MMRKNQQSSIFTGILTLAYILSACNAIPAGLGNDSTSQDNQTSGITLTDNSNEVNYNDNSVNDNSTNAEDSQNDNSDDNTNTNTDSDIEIVGVVEVMADGSITINGVTYQIADFTEFNDVVELGDNVMIHVVVNADGTLTIREIEKTGEVGGEDQSDDNTNINNNSNDTGQNSNLNGNSNSDDDQHNGNGNDDDQDDDDDDDNNGNSSDD